MVADAQLECTGFEFETPISNSKALVDSAPLRSEAAAAVEVAGLWCGGGEIFSFIIVFSKHRPPCPKITHRTC